MSDAVFKKKLLPQLITLTLAALAVHAAQAADEVAPAASAAASEKLDLVEVVGVRATLKKNLLEKRESNNIVDSIRAEDVGKFPDKNVADSLQRMPGVSVDRGWGEGKAIFVRGTDKNLNMTQLNGQAVASAEWWLNEAQTRSFNYDVLPSEIVGSLDIYKSPSADLDEGSVGGLVVVKTRKPLEFKERLTLQGSAEATYSKLPGKTDPQFSGLLNWQNENKTLGVLVSISAQKRTMRRDGLENFPDGKYNIVPVDKSNTPTGAAATNAYASWGGGSAIFRQDRERTTGNLAIQFRPTSETDFVLNYMNSDMKMNNNNQNYLWQASGQADAKGNIKVQNPSFITTSDGSKALVGGSIGDTNVSFEPIYRESFVKSKVLDLDGSYQGSNWKLHGQVGSTEAEGGSKHDRHFWMEGNATTQIDLGPDKYGVKYLNIDPLTYTGLTLKPGGGTSDRVRIMKSKENYGQADFSLFFDDSFINALKVGLKLRDSTQENQRSQGLADGTAASWQSFTLADLSTGASPLLSQKAATPGALTQYRWFDDGLVASKAIPMFDKNMVYTQLKNEEYKIHERISAGYVKAEYSSNKWRGDFGVRLVKTEQTSDGNAIVAGGYAPISVKNSYTDALPNLNVIYDLQKDVILRGAVSRVMSRHPFNLLSPSMTRDGTVLTAATAGNPLLKPVHSNQGELGAEWYYAEGAVLAGTAFVKKLDTFVYTVAAQEQVLGQTLNVTRPYNADNGADIKGFELQWQQPFGNSGFGTVMNYTYTDAKAGAVAGQPKLNVLGNSREQFNLSAYYEAHGFSVRASYNYRSKSYGDMHFGGQDVNSAYGQWDATASWDITPKLSLYGSAVNITNEVVRTNTTDGMPIGVYENGSRYSIGLRAKF